MENLNENKPFKTNQISQEKPSIRKSMSVLTGYDASSFNAGHNKTIAFKQVMPGEQHEVYFWQGSLSMLTPLTPTYQNLRITFRSYFVPNSAVWNNAEAFLSQKGGSTEPKVKTIPNLYGKKIPILKGNGNSTGPSLNATSIWRDSFISSYLPRINGGNGMGSETVNAYPLPTVSVLPLRGRVLIYNQLERNKQYDSPAMEYKGDDVTQEEWESYLPLDPTKTDYYTMRAKRGNSYYTDYRTELQGQETFLFEQLEEYTPNEALLRWMSIESKANELRAQPENSEKTDWQIIHELFGSKKLTEGKPQQIGEVTLNLNYAAITQNAYNTNDSVKPEFQVMGKQGAYSYTEVKVPLYAGIEFKESGYVHIIATVSADSVFENGFDRRELNVDALEQYRPDMKDDKLDVLYLGEMTTAYSANQIQSKYKQPVGFKRKWSEYYKLGNHISGDMCTNYIHAVRTDVTTATAVPTKFEYWNEKIYPNNTYQFFENDIETADIKYINDQGNLIKATVRKFIWKDYSDLQVNRNQAIENDVFGAVDNTGTCNIWVSGQNQIFYVGVSTCKAILPIEQAIKNNFTDWGEH